MFRLNMAFVFHWVVLKLKPDQNVQILRIDIWRYQMKNDYNEDMRNVTTSNSVFEEMIRDGSVYVDKTEYIYKLVSGKERFCFISRPRRYGKSLFCSTLHALFDGKRELFRDLYIGSTDYDFRSYPVIHLNFAMLSTLSISWFQEGMSGDIRRQGERLGVRLEGNDPSQLLKDLLYALDDAVIIIDEYDAPFTSSIDQEASIQTDIRNILSSFYSVIKNCSERIRFFFMTGVVKLANLSVFSAMNNLRDLSMDESFSAAFGYTDAELLEYFGEGIEECYEENKNRYRTREELLERIRGYYDGYRFSPESEESVYNPVSIGYFFTSGYRFENYWDRTGTSTLAVELARKVELSSIIDGSIAVSRMAFTNFDILSIREKKLSKDNVAALLYYAGYLTINDGDEFAIELIFPNKEVASSFSMNLISRYADESYSAGVWMSEFIRACRSGDEEAVMLKLKEYFAAFSYELIGKEREKFYHTIFHGIFVMAGLYAISEDRGLRGRADEVILTENDLWIFELKIDKEAEEAVRQIDKKGYREKYSYLIEPGMRIHEIGISFSSEERKISALESREK